MKKNFQDSVNNCVYEYRILAHLSQQGLADRVGVSKQTIFVMEKGNYIPSLLLALRIANFFDVSVTDIFNYTPGGTVNEQ